MTHNGHKNYETWVTSMFLDGNYDPDHEATYRHVRDLARQVSEVQDGDNEDRQRVLAAVLRDYVHDRIMPDGGLEGDLLAAALESIDWWALAGSQLEEVDGGV